MNDYAHDERLLAGLTAMVRRSGLPTAGADPLCVRDELIASGIDPQDAASMLAHGPQRLLAYRDLVRNRLSGTIRGALAKTTLVRGEAMQADVAMFLGARGPATHRMADVADEFVDWAAPTWAEAPQVPAYLPDLARLESSLRAVRRCDAPPLVSGAAGSLAPDQRVLFCGSARLLRLDYTVHLLTRANINSYAPKRQPVSLLLFRRNDGAARFYRVAEALAVTAERLLGGSTLGQALLDETTPDPIALARLLDALRERGVVAF